jgi:hypothetical protein
MDVGGAQYDESKSATGGAGHARAVPGPGSVVISYVRYADHRVVYAP